SHGDDARPAIARRVGYDNQTAGQQAQSDKPFFAIGESIVFEGDAGPGKYLLGILKAEAMLGEVLPVLRLVPVVFHSISRLIVVLFVVKRNVAKSALEAFEGRHSILNTTFAAKGNVGQTQNENTGRRGGHFNGEFVKGCAWGGR